MIDQNERNRLLAEEYRRSGGHLSEPQFQDGSVLLLTTRGRKSGREYVNPLRFLEDGGRYIVFASHRGAPTDPDWYKNLVAAETAKIEVGTSTLIVRPVELHGAERDEIYHRQATRHTVFGDYEERTSRVIPVIALVPVES